MRLITREIYIYLAYFVITFVIAIFLGYLHTCMSDTLAGFMFLVSFGILGYFLFRLIYPKYYIGKKYVRIGSIKIPLNKVKEIKVMEGKSWFKDVIIILCDGRIFVLSKVQKADSILEKIRDLQL